MAFKNMDDSYINDSFKVYTGNKYIKKYNDVSSGGSNNSSDTMWIQTQVPCIDSNHESSITTHNSIHESLITTNNPIHESFCFDWLDIFRCFPHCSFPHCSCPDSNCPDSNCFLCCCI